MRMFANSTHANEEGQLLTWFRPASWPDVKLDPLEERRVPIVGKVESHYTAVCGRRGKVQNERRSRVKNTGIMSMFSLAILSSY